MLNYAHHQTGNLHNLFTDPTHNQIDYTEFNPQKQKGIGCTERLSLPETKSVYN